MLIPGYSLMRHVVRWFLEGHVWMPWLLLVIPIENLLLKHSDIKIYKFIISASTKIFEHNVHVCVCVCVCGAGEGGLTKFSKRWSLTRSQCLEGNCWERGWSFSGGDTPMHTILKDSLLSCDPICLVQFFIYAHSILIWVEQVKEILHHPHFVFSHIT